MLAEHKVREFMAIAEAYGWKISVDVGYCLRGTDGDYCCPMGAVAIAMNNGFMPDMFHSRNIANILGCHELDVGDFIYAFDGKFTRNHGGKIGDKIRAEVLACG